MEDTKLILQAIQLVGEKVDRLGARIERLEERMDRLEERMDNLEEKVDELNQEVDNLKKSIFSLDTRVCGLALHIENVTDRNILQVAEGHFFLYERLLAAEKYAGPNELLHVRMNILEGEMKNFRAKLA